MKFLCSHCDGLSEIAKFHIEAETLIIPCSRCGKENRSTAHPSESAASLPPPLTEPPLPSPKSETEHAISDEEFIVPAGHCPKCLSRRASSAACPSCGLPANADGASFEPGEWLRTEWVSLLRNWSDAAQHQSLRQQAFIKEELAGLGRLYRLKLAQFPNDAIAHRGREEVVNMAMVSTLAAEKTPPPAQLTKKQLLVAGVVAASGIAFLMALVVKLFGD